jgi:hypothetical protein
VKGIAVPTESTTIAANLFGYVRQLISIGRSRSRSGLTRNGLIWVVVATTAATIGGRQAQAQQHNHPALNSFGRFFGIGWSHGYQSGSIDGRFQHIKDQHPASMYPSSRMLYPYSPNYSAMQVSYGQPTNHSGNMHWGGGSMTPAPHMHPGHAGYSSPAHGIVVPQPGANQKVQPAQPPKPVEPPPAWLKPFLNQDSEVIDTPKASQEAPEEVVPRQDSPSDKGRSKPANDDDDLLIPQTKLTPMQRYHQAQQLRMTNR